MGKWKKLRGKLESLPVERAIEKWKLKPLPIDKPWQKKIDDVKVKLLGTKNPDDANVARLARLFADRKREKRELESRIKTLNVELEALSQLGVDRVRDEEIETVKITGGLTVYVKDEPHTTIEDLKTAMVAAKQAGLLYLFTLQWNSLNKFNKTRVENGEKPLAGTKVWMRTGWHVLGLGAKDDD